MTRFKQKEPSNHNQLPTDPWEAAYLRFETPEEEIRKFVGRLQFVGAKKWRRDARIVELFCGRGNGLTALNRLGFTDIEGIDLSPTLAAQYAGPGQIRVGDCRELPFEDNSKDVLIVQGGLHHLPLLPDDLDRSLVEASRVLKPAGLLIVVEPWATNFLSLVHALCRNRTMRMLSPKIDAMATMIDYERQTYQQWLSQPRLILESLQKAFQCESCHFRMGKIYFTGRKRT